MAEKKKDSFFQNVNKFFQRVQNKDLIQISSNNLNNLNAPASPDELRRKSEFSIFRQYLNAKNWSTRHIELFDEYRKMDMTYPIISAALRLMAQEVCVAGDVVVTTPQGDFTIDQLVKKGNSTSYFYVQSYNKKAHKADWNEAFGIKMNGIKTVYKVTVHRNIDSNTAQTDSIKEASFKCTDNHPIMLPDGRFKELKDLRVGDEIFSFYKWVDPSCGCKKETFNKTSILSIEEAGKEPVYDIINVKPNHHFSLKLTDSFFIEVHNCTKDNDGNVFKIITDDKKIKKALNECFFDNLKMNSQSYLLAKEMLKFGNLFCFLNTRRGVGVTDIIHLPPEALRIQLIANAPELDSFKYQWWGGGGGLQFEPWEVVHWKNVEDIELQPYGTSVLRSVVDTWRRIILMREALIIYRITRAPQRYLFKIDTSGMDPDSALRFASEMKKQLQKKPLMNPHTGELDFKYNPISISEDFYQPTFEGDVGGIEVLQSPTNMNDVEDYKIIKDDLFAGLLIPKSYLCLHPNTEVKCLDGKNYTILELEEKYKKGEKVYTYSSTNEGNIIPGEITWVGPTQKFIKTYEVELDNGVKVECSDSHPWMMRDGTYKRADELKIDDSLMPLYTKLDSGYEKVLHNQVRKNNKQKWQLTHQMVANWTNSNFYHQDGNGKIIAHHKDFNKRNNNPENLIRCTQDEHIKFHENGIKNLCSPENRAKLKFNQQNNPEYSKKLSDSLKEDFKTNFKKKDAIREANKKYKKRNRMLEIHQGKIKNREISQFGENNGNFKGMPSKEDLLNILDNYKYEGFNKFRDLIRELFPNNKKNFTAFELSGAVNISYNNLCEIYGFKKASFNTKEEYLINEEEVIDLLKEGYLVKDICKKLKIGIEPINRYFLSKYGKGLYSYQKENLENIYYKKFKKEFHNHKVKAITIKEYEVPIQFYDLTIENEYHNFALTAGVFVHNSFEEDLCLRSTTKILTSEGVKEIWELAWEFEKEKEKKIYSLSCNKYGIMSSGKILWCNKTKLVDELYEITINHLHKVETTDNHPFLMEDLVYKRADELKVGDQLRGMYEKDFIVTDVKKIDLEEPEYVYDLEVENYHNFALECGIFVHNSNKAALSQEDMRFSGAIKQYQSAFVEGLLHVALAHLHISGCSEEELQSFSIEMNTNSTLVEKNRNEILQQRLDLAKGFLDDSYGAALMSYTQVMKDILKFTDEEIVKVFKDQMIEKKIFWRYAQLKEQGFYEEPNQDKKKAMMRALNPDGDDIFSDLKFESTHIPHVKDILTEKLDQELSYLKKSVKGSPTKKNIELIKESNYETNKNKALRDLGLKK